jgi:hypothetical protein
VPFTTLQNKATDAKFVSAGLSTHLKYARGHPRALNSDKRTVLVNRLLRLERICLNQTADQGMLGGRSIGDNLTQTSMER